jgi:Xaa-Pro aminopeptidase
MISPATYAQRLERLGDAVRQRGLDAALLGVGPELEWSTGYAAQGLERLTLLVVRADQSVNIIVPRLEAPAALTAAAMAAGAVPIVPWNETDDPVALVPRLVAGDGAPPTRVAVSDGMRAAFVLALQSALQSARFEVASTVVSPLRRVKDAEEIALLRAAAAAADRVITAVIAGPLIGRTEAEIAAEVRSRLVEEGHETAEFSIVAGGPNSASPHHEPSDRPVAEGEPLLFDIGGRRGGYCSDITRTVWVSGPSGAGPDADFSRIYELVRRAQAAACEAVRPGATFEGLDRAARAVITEGGHGDDFFHRLGHGIGLEVHEEPYLVEGHTEAVRAGETFSIEPGIYLEGRYGVRIEDQVACTTGGVDRLNQATRDLLIVAGT